VPADAAITTVARLLADPARVAMLLALSDGGEVAVSELAGAAGVSTPTASLHLAKLAAAGLVGMRRQGRHHLYRLLRPEVVRAMEALAVVAPEAEPRTFRQAKTGRAVRAARTCYDHLAGRFGVEVTRALVQRRALRSTSDGSFVVTRSGERLLGEMGVDLDAARASRRAFAPACLDWSERAPHLAGALGTGLLALFLEREWIRRSPASRAVEVTAAGRRAVARYLGATGQPGAR
jgi:DNA-binding transcriptional ArsR family regulator